MLEPVERLTGTGRIHLELAHRARRRPTVASPGPRRGPRRRLTHRALPFAVETLDVSGRWDDGRIVLETLTAQAGASPVTGRIEFQPAGAAAVVAGLSPPPGEPGRLPAAVRRPAE